MPEARALDPILQEPIWYHPIPYPGGVTKTFADFSGFWHIIRRARTFIDYKRAAVLDVASYDGLWAFEAEDLGAALVIASDWISLRPVSPTLDHRANSKALDKFMAIRAARGSAVLPAYTLDAARSLTPALHLAGQLFDIVQCLGLLYHVRDPWAVLEHCRSVVARGGTLLLETAATYGSSMTMTLNRGQTEFYADRLSFWFPSLPCLWQMLHENEFRVSEAFWHPQKPGICRVCCVARRA